MRILITVTPLMYREGIAFLLQSRRPGFDVLLGSANSLDGPASEFEPHMVIKDDTETMSRDGAICVVEISYKDSMSAKITLDEEVWLDSDLSTRTLLQVADLTRGMI